MGIVKELILYQILNTSFVDDVLYVYLPSLQTNHEYNTSKTVYSDPNFIFSWFYILGGLSHKYTYVLDYNLMIRTNGANIRKLFKFDVNINENDPLKFDPVYMV